MPSTDTKHTEKAARLFQALSDETRLRILERLRDGEQCVCELTDTFRTGQSRLSFHVKVLKDAGLVHDRPQGRWIYYSLNQKGLGPFESGFQLRRYFRISSSFGTISNAVTVVTAGKV